MRISAERLIAESEATGFQPDFLEKAFQLLALLDAANSHPGKLALKGGTALNLFDSRLTFSMEGLYIEKLRVAFVLYGAMNRADWRRVSVDDITFDPTDLARQPLPALHNDGAQELRATDYGETLVEESRAALSALLPFTGAERNFLDSPLDEGEVRPELLTEDVELQGRIRTQSLLAWKAQNVREYMGLS